MLGTMKLFRIDSADMGRAPLGIEAVLDGVFLQRLQRQRRETEGRVRRVELREDQPLIARLLDREIGPRMGEFLGKGDQLEEE